MVTGMPSRMLTSAVAPALKAMASAVWRTLRWMSKRISGSNVRIVQNGSNHCKDGCVSSTLFANDRSNQLRIRHLPELEYFMSRGILYSCRFVGLLLVLSTLACQTNTVNSQDAEITTVILVRHAEKELTGDDPELTATGAERALALAHVVGEVDVSAVYATQFARTRNTAVPLSSLLGLDVSVVAAGQSYAADMADIVHTQHQGETVVIVSHSNTVPAIIAELGVTPVPVIDDDEYDDLYVVIITATGQVRLLPLRYGLETP